MPPGTYSHLHSTRREGMESVLLPWDKRSRILWVEVSEPRKLSSPGSLTPGGGGGVGDINVHHYSIVDTNTVTHKAELSLLKGDWIGGGGGEGAPGDGSDKKLCSRP